MKGVCVYISFLFSLWICLSVVHALPPPSSPSSSSSSLIFFDNTAADRCSYQAGGCSIADATVWVGGVAPGFNSSFLIGWNMTSNVEIYLYVDFDTPVYNTIYMYRYASLFVNSTGNLNAKMIEAQGTLGTVIVQGLLNVSYVQSDNTLVDGGTIIGKSIGEGVLTLYNASVTADSIVLGSLSMNISVVSASTFTTTNLYLWGQNSISVVGVASDSPFASVNNLQQADVDTPSSFLNLTASIGNNNNFDFVFKFYGTSLRAVLNIYPGTTVVLAGNATLLPYPATSSIASVYGGGVLSTIYASIANTDVCILSSPVPFASNFTLSPAGEIQTPYIAYPTILNPWQPSTIITSSVSTDIYAVFNYSGEALNISGNVIARNLVVSVGFPNSAFNVEGNLTIEGNVTVIETAPNATWVDCQPNGQVLIAAASSNVTTSNSSSLVYVPFVSQFANLYSQNNFVWSLVSGNESLYVQYNSTASDCHSDDHHNKFPKWALYLLVIGGGALLGVIIIVYLIYTRRRSGYESLPVVSTNN